MSKKTKIGIVGLGLIGGSIEKALKEKPDDFEILLVSQSQGSPLSIKDLSEVDIVFLCGTQKQIPNQLEEIARLISKARAENQEHIPFANTLITDVASTKTNIAKVAEELGLVNFVAGHPMAGTEHKGYSASFPTLFHNANWILSESSERTKLLEQIITNNLGAKIVVMDPESHDRGVALTSHLALVLSIALGDMVDALPQVKQLIGPGFKSMTRLACGNAELGREIISLNRHNIKETWKLYKEEVESLLEIYGSDLENELELVKNKLYKLEAPVGL
jgi:prephenate dehydrogenase